MLEELNKLFTAYSFWVQHRKFAEDLRAFGNGMAAQVLRQENTWTWKLALRVLSWIEFYVWMHYEANWGTDTLNTTVRLKAITEATQSHFASLANTIELAIIKDSAIAEGNHDQTELMIEDWVQGSWTLLPGLAWHSERYKQTAISNHLEAPILSFFDSSYFTIMLGRAYWQEHPWITK